MYSFVILQLTYDSIFISNGHCDHSSQSADASNHIYVSQWPVINVKASFCA